MATLKLTAFSGEIPRIMPRLLPDMAARFASNTRLTNGGLTPVRKPKRITTLANPPADDEGTIYLQGNDWLAWPGLVHVVPGPVDSARLYIFGDGAPQMRLDGVTYPLAVQEPTAALSASVSGTGNGDDVTRLYAYTFVTEFGEETLPSPLTDEVVWEPGQTVTLSGFQAGDASRGVDRQRIYRTQTGSQGTALYFIAERATTTNDFTDDIPVDDFAEPIPSTNWDRPPDDLVGLTAMPNGMMAAFRGHDVYFCEPYRPHAWPQTYVLTVDYPVVALGAFGSSLAILTEGNPYIASGLSPSSMVMEKLELNLPCINAWGVVDLGYAVAYPSHDGLVVVSPGGARVATESLFSRDDWQRYSPTSFAAGQYDGRYYASYIYTDERNVEQRGSMVIDLSGDQPFIIRTNIETRSFYYDIRSGFLYYLLEGEVFQWDPPGRVNATQEWVSKDFYMPRPTNFGIVLIETFSYLSPEELALIEAERQERQDERDTMYESSASIGGDINGHHINETEIAGDLLPEVISTNQDISVNVYADDALVAAVGKHGDAARLPAGFKARKWRVSITGNMRVEQVTLATTGAELMGV